VNLLDGAHLDSVVFIGDDAPVRCRCDRWLAPPIRALREAAAGTVGRVRRGRLWIGARCPCGAGSVAFVADRAVAIGSFGVPVFDPEPIRHGEPR
jgi:hypothetical protein